MDHFVAFRIKLQLTVLCVCLLLGRWTRTNNVYNTTNLLFMLVTVIVYGSTAYIPAIILERPLYIRQGTRIRMHRPACMCILLTGKGSVRRRWIDAPPSMPPIECRQIIRTGASCRLAIMRTGCLTWSSRL